MKILIQGWTRYPHSYSLVNVYQIIALSKLNNVYLTIDEQPPFNSEWEAYDNLTDFLLTAEEQHTLDSIPKYNKNSTDKFDIVYRITYPYNIENPSHEPALTVLFYTAEFQKLDDKHFQGGTLKSFIDKCFSRKLLPVTPSEWSANALRTYKFEPLVIPHGVDITKYYPLERDVIDEFRDELNIPKNAFVFLMVGAMTQNKNVKGSIKAFYRLACLKSDVYLVLKGIRNLYSSQKFINDTIKQLRNEGSISDKQWKIVKNRLIYIDEFFGYKDMCKLYNSADCYLSPYVAEGFNIPVLEAAACGVSLIVPKGGSTDDFTKPQFAKYPVTTLTRTESFEKLLLVDDTSLLETMLNVYADVEFRQTCKILAPEYVRNNFTWSHVAEIMYNFFNFIIPEINLKKINKMHYIHSDIY